MVLKLLRAEARICRNPVKQLSRVVQGQVSGVSLLPLGVQRGLTPEQVPLRVAQRYLHDPKHFVPEQ